MKALTVGFDMRNWTTGGRHAIKVRMLARDIEQLRAKCDRATQYKQCNCAHCWNIKRITREIDVLRHGEPHVQELDRRRAYAASCR